MSKRKLQIAFTCYFGGRYYYSVSTTVDFLGIRQLVGISTLKENSSIYKDGRLPSRLATTLFVDMLEEDIRVKVSQQKKKGYY